MQRVTIVVIAATLLFSLKARAVPAPPTLNAPQVNGPTVAISWSAPTGALTYRLEVGTAAGLSNVANSLIGNITTLTAPNIPAGTYYVRVRSVAFDGESAPSNEVVVVVGGGGGCAAPPGAASGLTSNVSGNLVTLTWRRATGGCDATNFIVYAGSAAGLNNIASLSAGNVQSVSATAPNGTYYVYVVAQNGFGQSGPSNVATVVIGGPSTPPAPVGLLVEDFEDGVLDPRISVRTVGTFTSLPGIKNVPNFGSTKAFGYGLSPCGASCFDRFATSIFITFPGPEFVGSISFKEMELFSNWGSGGAIFIDGQQISASSCNAVLCRPYFDLGRTPVNDFRPDTSFRSRSVMVNRAVRTIELQVWDITNQSEIYLDDLVVTR